MINIAFTVLSLAVLVVAVVVRGGDTGHLDINSNTQVLSETSEASVSPTPTEIPTASPSETPTATASATPSATKTPQPIVLPTSTPNLGASGPNISTWTYPGADISSQTATKLTMTVSGDPKVVTAWYKDRMNGMGFNAKSVIQTQSNEKTLNKLSGASSSASLMVEIKRDTANVPLNITVDLTASNSSI